MPRGVLDRKRSIISQRKTMTGGQNAGEPGRSCSLTFDPNANSSHDRAKKIDEIFTTRRKPT
jgi:hypothetical protein